MKTKNNRKQENHKKQKAQKEKENRKQKTTSTISVETNHQTRHQVRTSSFPRNDVSPKNRAKEVDGKSEGTSTLETPGADTFKAMFFNTKPENEVRSRDAMI